MKVMESSLPVVKRSKLSNISSAGGVGGITVDGTQGSVYENWSMYKWDCRISASDIGGEMEVFVEVDDPDVVDEVDAESTS